MTRTTLERLRNMIKSTETKLVALIKINIPEYAGGRLSRNLNPFCIFFASSMQRSSEGIIAKQRSAVRTLTQARISMGLAERSLTPVELQTNSFRADENTGPVQHATEDQDEPFFD